MAVLVEAISVIIKIQSIEQHGGLPKFEELLKKREGTLCMDGLLARVGFMVPEDVEKYCRLLEEKGLLHQVDNKAHDFVVVDQQIGCTTPCDWLEVGEVDPGYGSIVCCRLVSDENLQVFTPDGWTFPGSLSDTFGFVPTGTDQKGLRFLRHDNGTDVYMNEVTGEEVYVGRST